MKNHNVQSHKIKSCDNCVLHIKTYFATTTVHTCALHKVVLAVTGEGVKPAFTKCIFEYDYITINAYDKEYGDERKNKFSKTNDHRCSYTS